MATSYTEYKSRITSLHDYPATIEEARREYDVGLSVPLPHMGIDIPFHLEAEYFNALLDRGEYEEAERTLYHLEASYPIHTAQNLVALYRYRLRIMRTLGVSIRGALDEAKREAKDDLNQHTILLVGLVAGIIVIFGAATAIFRAASYEEAWMTFIGISFAVIVLVFVAFACNYLFRRRK